LRHFFSFMNKLQSGDCVDVSNEYGGGLYFLRAEKC
jgi:hypothetical protein